MTTKAVAHWYCGDHTNMDPFRSLFNAASSEKEEMIYLNDRLADLLMKIEDMKGKSGKFDNSAWIRAIHCLEEEIKKLKAFYEAELSKTRREFEVIVAEKTEAYAANEKCKNERAHLQLKLDDEAKENQIRRDEIAEFKCELIQKEREIVELTKYVSCLKAEIALLRPKLEKYEQEAEHLRQQLDCERRLRQDAEDKNAQFVTKLNFDTRLHEQQVRDLNDRLDHAHEIIESLNKKIREMQEKTGTSNPVALMQKIREQMQAEFEKYRADTEMAVNRTIKDMKEKLDRRLRELQLLEEEKDRLEEIVARLQGQMNQIQSQLTAALQGNQQLQLALQNERQAAAQKQRELEMHLRDAQDCLMQKIREAAAAREVQTGLRAEIESLKTLIEIEEDKLTGACLPPLKCGNTGLLYATQGYPNRNIGCRTSSDMTLSNPISGNKNLLREGNRPQASGGGQLPHDMKRGNVLTTLTKCM